MDQLPELRRAYKQASGLCPYVHADDVRQYVRDAALHLSCEGSTVNDALGVLLSLIEQLSKK